MHTETWFTLDWILKWPGIFHCFPISTWSNNDRSCFFCLFVCVPLSFVFVCLFSVYFSYIPLFPGLYSATFYINRELLIGTNMEGKGLSSFLQYCTNVTLKWLKKNMIISALITALQPEFEFVVHNSDMLLPVAVRSKTWVWSRLSIGIAGSNPNRGMDIRLLCLYVFCG